MNWLWMHVLKCNMHEKSAGHADLGWFCRGSRACLMASPQALPFLSLPSRFWNTSPLHLTVNCQCIMFFSLIVLSKPDWPYFTSDRVLHFDRYISNRTGCYCIIIQGPPGSVCRQLCQDYGCHPTSPDTKDTRGQEAQEAGGESDVPFLPPSVNKRKNP